MPIGSLGLCLELDDTMDHLMYEAVAFNNKIQKLEEALVKGLAEKSIQSDIKSFVNEVIKESGLFEAKTMLDKCVKNNARDKQNLRPANYDHGSKYISECRADSNYFYYRKCHEMIVEQHQLKKDLKKLKYQSDEVPVENSEISELKKSGLLKRHRSGLSYMDIHSDKRHYPLVDQTVLRNQGYLELYAEMNGRKRRLTRDDLRFNIDLLSFDMDSDGELLEADPNPPKKRKLPIPYKKGKYFTCNISPCNYMTQHKIYCSGPIQAFETSEDLKNHVKQHHLEFRHGFQTLNFITGEKEYDPSIKTNLFICEDCPWSGDSENAVRLHQQSTTHKKDFKKSTHTVECKLCEIKVISKASLLKHNKRFHMI